MLSNYYLAAFSLQSATNSANAIMLELKLANATQSAISPGSVDYAIKDFSYLNTKHPNNKLHLVSSYDATKRPTVSISRLSTGILGKMAYFNQDGSAALIKDASISLDFNSVFNATDNAGNKITLLNGSGYSRIGNEIGFSKTPGFVILNNKNGTGTMFIGSINGTNSSDIPEE